jgi:hypothetical protein
MPSTLGQSDFMVRGSQYTFSFTPSGMVAAVYRPSVGDITGAINMDPLISGMSVSDIPASFWSLANDQIDITFTYAGDGTDQVSDMANALMDDLSNLSTNFSFLGAYGGRAGTAPDVTGIDTTLAATKKAAALLPSTTGLVAIAVIVLLGVFVLSGGAGATRGALSVGKGVV